MLTSILHRATGSALMVGAGLLTWFLVALASGSESFALFASLAGSLVGQVILFGLTVALMQHMASGIRHLFMDTGALFGLKINSNTAVFTYVFSVLASVGIWVAAYMVIKAG